jgi:hypothetical protein
MNAEYLSKLENLKQDLEQIQKKDKELRVECKDNGKTVSCIINSTCIRIVLEDKELETLINKAIEVCSLQYSTEHSKRLQNVNKRVMDELQPIMDIGKMFEDGIKV